MSVMQAIIQQEAQIYNVVIQLLPTVGMLIEVGDNQAQVLEKTANLLRLQGQNPQAISVIMAQVAGCVARMTQFYATAQTAPAAASA
jgi:hypothetical protein